MPTSWPLHRKAKNTYRKRDLTTNKTQKPCIPWVFCFLLTFCGTCWVWVILGQRSGNVFSSSALCVCFICFLDSFLFWNVENVILFFLQSDILPRIMSSASCFRLSGHFINQQGRPQSDVFLLFFFYKVTFYPESCLQRPVLGCQGIL